MFDDNFADGFVLEIKLHGGYRVEWDPNDEEFVLIDWEDDIRKRGAMSECIHTYKIIKGERNPYVR